MANPTVPKYFRLPPDLAADLAAAADGETETAIVTRALRRELDGAGEELAKVLDYLLVHVRWLRENHSAPSPDEWEESIEEWQARDALRRWEGGEKDNASI